MVYKLLLILFLVFHPVMASAKTKVDCHLLMTSFFAKTEQKIGFEMLTNRWSDNEKKEFLSFVRELDFSSDHIRIMIDSLNLQVEGVSIERTKSYVNYALSLTQSNRKEALFELAYLDRPDIESKYIKKFLSHEKKIQEKFSSKKMTPNQKQRYEELYHGCRALSPNNVNRNAAKDFKKFNLSLNLGTLAASYAFYNMDKEINGEWFAKLGYDIGVTVMYSYVGSKIQTKATDTQIAKSLKSYFSGRIMSFTDILIYDPLFNNEHQRARQRVEELKNNPDYKKEVEKLLIEYENKNLYKKYKDELIIGLKKLPSGISMGVKGNSVDENKVDWNNLTHADLDRPEVQDVLVAAAMAQVYQENKGEWIEAGDAGLDRYVFNTVFFGTQIPRSLLQNYVTYRILCMGQDNSKLSFTKAVLFNVTMSFFSNQLLFYYREKAIGM